MSEETIQMIGLRVCDVEDARTGKLYKFYPGNTLECPESVARYVATQGIAQAIIVETRTTTDKKSKG